MATTPSQTIKLSRKLPLKLKLSFFTDDNEELQRFVDNYAGTRMGAFELGLAILELADTPEVAWLATYATVPAWRWIKLYRLNRELGEQLANG